MAKVIGRPSAYSDQIAGDICARLADGESLKAICADEGMPSRSSVFRWLGDPDKSMDHFRASYARAREASADADADSISDIAGQVLQGLVEPNAARVAIDALKWAAGKRKPKVYGDKIDHTSSDGTMTPKPTIIEFITPDLGGKEETAH